MDAASITELDYSIHSPLATIKVPRFRAGREKKLARIKMICWQGYRSARFLFEMSIVSED